MRGRVWKLLTRGCLAAVVLAVVAGLGVGWLVRSGGVPWHGGWDRELADTAMEGASPAQEGQPGSGEGDAVADDAAGRGYSDLVQEEPPRGVSEHTMEGTVEQVATYLLTSYRDAGDCVLADAGYLDLLGLVWGCVVRGDGWVDVCVVFEGQDESSCAVRVLRLEAAEVEGLFAEEDEQR